MRKPSFTPCEFQCAGGCGIYDQRPPDCRKFECDWLRGLHEGMRPDSSGFVIETTVLKEPDYPTLYTIVTISILPAFAIDELHRLVHAQVDAGRTIILIRKGEQVLLAIDNAYKVFLRMAERVGDLPTVPPRVLLRDWCASDPCAVEVSK